MNCCLDQSYNNHFIKMREDEQTSDSVIAIGQIAIQKKEKNQSIRDPETKVCRICLVQEEGSDISDQMFSPCDCTGSMKFVHKSCLLKWVEKINQRNRALGNPSEAVSCELCRYQFQLQIKREILCNDCQAFKQRIQQYKIIFVLCVLFMVGGLAGLFYLVSWIPTEKKRYEEQNDGRGYLIISVSIVLFCVLIVVWTLRFIHTFLIVIKYEAKDILPKSTIANNP